MKKVKNIIIWTLIAAYVVVAFGFVANKRSNLVCTEVEVRVTDSLRNAFVSDDNIKAFLKRKGIELVGTNFKNINLQNLENILNNYPPIDKAEVFKTFKGKVVFEIKQRNPILRVIDVKNESYYIDENGYIMKLSGNFTSHVMIANGSIHTTVPISSKINVADLEKNAKGKRIIVAELYKLAKFITENKFWNAQIEQIYVTGYGEIELIPMVGSQIVVLGDISDLESKFENLMSLYMNGFPAVGWNKYESINLKYKGQVICTKRE